MYCKFIKSCGNPQVQGNVRNVPGAQVKDKPSTFSLCHDLVILSFIRLTLSIRREEILRLAKEIMAVLIPSSSAKPSLLGMLNVMIRLYRRA